MSKCINDFRYVPVYLYLMIVPFLFSGCERREGLSGPDRELAIKEALPVGQYLLSNLQGKEMVRVSNIWVQHLAGVRGNEGRIDYYDIDNNYLDASWEEVYVSANYHFDLVVQYSTEIKEYAYRGIAKILQAYMFSLVTDLFGDIPFTEAIMYLNAGKPGYDSQEEVYRGINSLIQEGISDLVLAMNSGSELPAPDVDYMYQGDIEKWLRAANLLKLRITLKISHQDNNYNHSLEVIEESSLFENNSNNLLFPYDIHDDLKNPRYEFDQKVRNVRVSEKIVTMLTDSNDPRLSFFIKKNSSQEFSGSGPGELNQSASFAGSAFASATSPIYFLTYSEQKFIEAEVYFRLNSFYNAFNAFREGIIASLDQFGIDDLEWVDAQAGDIQHLTLEKIMNAKYVAMFLHSESWADWRRTGYPNLEIPQGTVLGNQFPRRYPYPSMEFFYNQNNVPDHLAITDKVWWDVE